VWNVSAGKRDLKPSGLGDLNKREVGQIQRTVDIAGRSLDVVGSAAKGERRDAGLDLPYGKGFGTKSDIDYTTAASNAQNFQNLPLPGLDEHGVLKGVPDKGTTSIRFEPGHRPRMVEN
jgi:hypothetical protein